MATREKNVTSVDRSISTRSFQQDNFFGVTRANHSLPEKIEFEKKKSFRGLLRAFYGATVRGAPKS